MKEKLDPGKSPEEGLTWSNKKPVGSSSVLISNDKTCNWILGVLKTAQSKTDLNKGQIKALVDEAFRSGSDD